MKFLKFAALAALSIACLSCKEDEPNLPKLILGGDSAFSTNATATVNLMLSEPSSSNVTAYLVCGTEVQEGFTAIPVDLLTFDNQVVIKAGESSAKTTVTLDASKLTANVKYQAAIVLSSASGAEISENLHTLYISAEGGHYGGNGGNDNPGGGDTIVPEMVLQSNWSMSVGEVGTDEYGDYVLVNVTAPGLSGYLGVVAFTPADWTTQYGQGGISALAADIQSDIDADLADNWSVAEILYTLSEDIYAEYPGEGEATFYLFEFNDNGKLTGKYGKSVLNVPEIEETTVPGQMTGPLSLQSNWSVKFTEGGEIWEGLDGYYIDIDVTAPGATYFWVDNYTEAELDYYYPDGGISAMLLDYSSSIKTSLAEGDSVSDLMWAPGEDEVFSPYYGAGETDFYIMDFDANGNATGKYGVTRLTAPEMETSTVSGLGVKKALKVKFRIHRVDRPVAKKPRFAKRGR